MKMSLGRVMALGAIPVVILTMGLGNASARPLSGSPPPPKGFEALSASFVSSQTGFALGGRGCSVLPCAALLEKTGNGGKTWTKVSAPAPKLTQPFNPPPKNGVSTVRFANTSDGWLFNPGLWETTDGGVHWKSVSLPGMVTNLEAAGGEVFAVVRPSNGSSNQAHLYQGAVGSGKWTLVPKVIPQVTLTAFGHSAWTGISPSLWRTTNSGKTWSKLSFSCPSDHPDSSAVAAATANDVAIVCASMGDPQPGFSKKEIWVSSNGGRTFHQTSGHPGLPGEPYLLAMPVNSPKVITLAAASGASYFYKTYDGGKTWTHATYYDGGTGFRDLAYVSATAGFAIHFSGTPMLAYSLGLMKTVNAGKSWTTVKIP